MSRNKLCPQCKIRRFQVKNDAGQSVVVMVSENNEIIPIVQPKGVQKLGKLGKKSFKIASIENNEPKKMNGNTCMIESLMVTTHTLLFTLFIFGAKLFSNQEIMLFI